MHKNILKVSSGAIACIFAVNAFAYDKAKVINMAPWPAAVTVKYAACKGDSFTVPAATKDKIGVASPTANRGACLIRSISATLNGKNYPVSSYTSSGTSYSEFIITYVPPYAIKSKHELGAAGWAANSGNTNSPVGDYGYPLGSDPHPEKERAH